MSDPRNFGHGHVKPRPDGVKARCGGPALCQVCRDEQALHKAVADFVDEILPESTLKRIFGEKS